MRIAKKFNKKTNLQIISTTIGGVFLISGIIFAVILVMQPQLINSNAQVATNYNTIGSQCGDGCGDYPIIGGSWCGSKQKFCCPVGMRYLVGIGCKPCGVSECNTAGTLRCVNYKDTAGKVSSYWEKCVEINGYNGCPKINVLTKVSTCYYKANCACGMP